MEFQLRGLYAPQSLPRTCCADYAVVGSTPPDHGPARFAAEMGRLYRAVTFMLLAVLSGMRSPVSHMQS